jgi:DNA replication licensing factor MCM6
MENSIFVDWQKVRVQENSEEIPSGSMPRTLELILRNDEVEKAKAGDKCIFTGTLIVVPELTKGRAPGPKIQGLKNAPMSKNKQGPYQVKEYAYKMCFLACTVSPAGSRVHFN